MATRQYIGARYVPTFANPIQWNSSISYEALTIVTNAGSSYTSRKPVPAGTPLTNSEYWVNTGNFNAQVQELQNEIDNVSNQVDINTDAIAEIAGSLLSGKKVVIYGDSNSDQTASVSSQTLQPNWVTKFIAMNPSTTVTNRSVSGRRVSGAGGVASAINSATDLNVYDIMIIFAGVNDWQHSVPLGNASSSTVDTFIGAMNVINGKVNADNKDMKVYFISPIKTYRTSDQMPSDWNELMRLVLYRIAIKKCCNAYNWNYIEGSNAPRLNTSATSIRNQFIVDGLHMATSYAEVFAEFVSKAIIDNRNDPIGFADCLIDLSSLVNTETWTVNYARLIVDGNGLGHLLLSLNGTFTNASTLMTLSDTFKPAFASQGHSAVVEGGVYTIANVSINPSSGGITVQCPGTHTSAIVTADLMFSLAPLYFPITGSV